MGDSMHNHEGRRRASLRLAALAGLLTALVAGCEGASFGEAGAGKDTFLGAGALAVDHLTDTTFVLQQSGSDARLLAVREDGTASAILPLGGHTDVRVLFPEAGVLVMAESAGADRLHLLDRGTLAPLKSRVTSARYHGTRMSPSRSWVAVVDNADQAAPIHILEAATLEARPIPHGGAWLEAMWLNGSDRLAAAIFETGPLSGQAGAARVRVWDMAKVAAGAFAVGASGEWIGAERDVDLGQVMPGLIGSLSWIAVAPGDATLAVPIFRVLETGGGGTATKLRGELAVVDLAKETASFIPDAYGPVSYTADGSTIVAFRQAPAAAKAPAGDDGDGGAPDAAPQQPQRELVLVHLPSMVTETVPVPVPGMLSFFVSHKGSWVVMTTTDAGSGFLLHDLSNGKTTQLSNSGGSLTKFVVRDQADELWAIDSGKLVRLSMAEATLQDVPLPFVPQQINLLPGKDLLVLAEKDAQRLHFVSPISGTSSYFVELPPMPNAQTP